MFQLVYTSAPRLLEAGKTGFGTVARSRELPTALVGYLERQSAFDRAAGVSGYCFYSLYRMGQSEYRVFSRVADCGVDYTHRTNHVAHHIIVPVGSAEDAALAQTSPAGALLALRHSFVGAWTGAPSWLQELPLPAALPPAETGLWQSLTGNAGNTRHLLHTGSSGCYLHTDGKMEEAQWLQLLHAAMLPRADKGWALPFCTAKVSTLNSNAYLLCCVDGAQKAAGVALPSHTPCLHLHAGLQPPAEEQKRPQPVTAAAPGPAAAPCGMPAPVVPAPAAEQPLPAVAPVQEPPSVRREHSGGVPVWLYGAAACCVVLAGALYLGRGGTEPASPPPAAEKKAEQGTTEKEEKKKASAAEKDKTAAAAQQADAAAEAARQAENAVKNAFASACEAAKEQQNMVAEKAAAVEASVQAAETAVAAAEKAVNELLAAKGMKIPTFLPMVRQHVQAVREGAQSAADAVAEAERLADGIQQPDSSVADAVEKAKRAAVEARTVATGAKKVGAADAAAAARKAAEETDAAVQEIQADKTLDDLRRQIKETADKAKARASAGSAAVGTAEKYLAAAEQAATIPGAAEIPPCDVECSYSKDGTKIKVNLKFRLPFADIAERLWVEPQATLYLYENEFDPDKDGGIRAGEEHPFSMKPMYEAIPEDLTRLRAKLKKVTEKADKEVPKPADLIEEEFCVERLTQIDEQIEAAAKEGKNRGDKKGNNAEGADDPLKKQREVWCAALNKVLKYKKEINAKQEAQKQKIALTAELAQKEKSVLETVKTNYSTSKCLILRVEERRPGLLRIKIERPKAK